MNTRVLINPTAGRGKAGRAEQAIRRRVGDQAVVVTQSVEDLRGQVALAVEEGVERLVTAGGDGTMHQAIQLLAGTRVALGVLPLGSGNDLARELGTHGALERALDTVLNAPTRVMDLGRVGERYFALYCGFGFDSEVSHTYNHKVKWIKGTPGYIWSVLRAMFSFEPPGMRLTFDDGEVSGRITLAMAANTRMCGGGMLMAPMASSGDGHFDLVYLDGVPKHLLVRLLSKVFSGGHIGHPNVHHVRTQSLAVQVDRPLWVYGDGEPLAQVTDEPVVVTMCPGALHVVDAAV